MSLPSSPLEWLDWAARVAGQLELSATEAAVLTKLARHADRDGLARPHVETIASCVRRSASAVFRALKSLSARGLIAAAALFLAGDCRIVGPLPLAAA